VAFGDQGYTGEDATAAAAAHGIHLEVVKLPAAKRGFVLLPRRWVVERSFAWVTRFRRLARDDERLPETVRGLHFVAFACRIVRQSERLSSVSGRRIPVIGPTPSYSLSPSSSTARDPSQT